MDKLSHDKLIRSANVGLGFPDLEAEQLKAHFAKDQTRTTQVAEQLKSLSTAVDRIEKAVVELDSRLHNVLIHDSPIVQREVEDEGKKLVPLATELNIRVEKLKDVIELAENMLVRLEL